MTEVISVKFKNRGKAYYFAASGVPVDACDKVVVETSKGLELADCVQGNHEVPDESIVQPLRPVIRRATADDLRVDEINRKREKEAFGICQKKIAEHGLDMKLVDVECNFEGNKIMFFFTSDSRVDFRELVKDLASVFRSRIELRQIGVRDEAKMIGGIGACGRQFCCSGFLNEFQPVSTKMAKVQSMSLNPTKISGACGRLMCCLRYEEDAYEDLMRNTPKNGTFVETPAGFGNVIQVNLLRQSVKVRLDGEGEDVFRLFDVEEIAVIPGGRPKDGIAPASILALRPKKVEKQEEWEMPDMLAYSEPSSAKPQAEAEAEEQPTAPHKKRSGRRRRAGRENKGPEGQRESGGQGQEARPPKKQMPKNVVKPVPSQPGETAEKPSPDKKPYNRRRRGRGGGKKQNGQRPE